MLKEWREQDMNMNKQTYRGLPLHLMYDANYNKRKAKQYIIGDTSLSVWIPNSYLETDGTIKEGVNIMWIFQRSDNYEKLFKAGYKFTY